MNAAESDNHMRRSGPSSQFSLMVRSMNALVRYHTFFF